MRALFAVLFCAAATAAHAGAPGPCPSFTAGWSLSSPGPITGILWDQTTQQMYFIQNHGLPPNTTTVSDFYPVPTSSEMQTFSRTPYQQWPQTFSYLIAPRYKALLLQEINNCPVLQDSFPVLCLLENENNISILITETSISLSTENPVCPSAETGGFIWVN